MAFMACVPPVAAAAGGLAEAAAGALFCASSVGAVADAFGRAVVVLSETWMTGA
jgi:hypothetical protein